MRKERKKIKKGDRGGSRHPQTRAEVEDTATGVINDQSSRGEIGDTDRAPETSDDEKRKLIADSTKTFGVDKGTAEEWADETIRGGRRILLKSVTLGHQDAFFDVESVNDVIEVWLNEQHPVHEHLIDVVTLENRDRNSEELVSRLQKAAFTLHMLLIAWARHEDKAPAAMKDTLEDVRMDWGREARKFMNVIE